MPSWKTLAKQAIEAFLETKQTYRCNRCSGKGMCIYKETCGYARSFGLPSSYYIECTRCNGTGKIIKTIPLR
jgi:DnaJ-class molecular chaperone